VQFLPRIDEERLMTVQFSLMLFWVSWKCGPEKFHRIPMRFPAKICYKYSVKWMDLPVLSGCIKLSNAKL